MIVDESLYQFRSIICSSCNRPSLIYDNNKLEVMDGDDPITSEIFSYIHGFGGPRPGDILKCYYCGKSILKEIRDAWRNSREDFFNRNKIGEWDK